MYFLRVPKNNGKRTHGSSIKKIVMGKIMINELSYFLVSLQGVAIGVCVLGALVWLNFDAFPLGKMVGTMLEALAICVLVEALLLWFSL